MLIAALFSNTLTTKANEVQYSEQEVDDMIEAFNKVETMPIRSTYEKDEYNVVVRTYVTESGVNVTMQEFQPKFSLYAAQLQHNKRSYVYGNSIGYSIDIVTRNEILGVSLTRVEVLDATGTCTNYGTSINGYHSNGASIGKAWAMVDFDTSLSISSKHKYMTANCTFREDGYMNVSWDRTGDW